MVRKRPGKAIAGSDEAAMGRVAALVGPSTPATALVAVVVAALS
jgi:hypothetical protein